MHSYIILASRMRSFLIFSILLCFGLPGITCAGSANTSSLSIKKFEKGYASANKGENSYLLNDAVSSEDGDSIFNIEDDDDEYRNEEHGSMDSGGLTTFYSSVLNYSQNNLVYDSAFSRQSLTGILYIEQRSLLI